MPRFSLSEYFSAVSHRYYVQASLGMLPGGGAIVSPDALIARMEALTARSRENPAVAARSPESHSDAKLLGHRQTLDDAWSREIAAVIAQKRLKTPEAGARAKEARAATASIVRKIERTRATTLEGLELKARAALWRRYSGPPPVAAPVA